MTSASTIWIHGLWMPYCTGREAATSSLSGNVPEMATAHMQMRSRARATLVACLQGPPPDASEEVVPGGAEPPCVEVGGVPSDVTVAGGQLVHVQRPGVVRADYWVVVESDLSSADLLAQDRSAVTCFLSHTGPPRWCSMRCPVSSGWAWSVCTAMCGSCGTSVATSRVVLRGGPRGLGWPAPTCTIAHSARSCACSVTRAHWSSLVTNHTGLSAWGRGRRGSGHARSA